MKSEISQLLLPSGVIEVKLDSPRLVLAPSLTNIETKSKPLYLGFTSGY